MTGIEFRAIPFIGLPELSKLSTTVRNECFPVKYTFLLSSLRKYHSFANYIVAFTKCTFMSWYIDDRHLIRENSLYVNHFLNWKVHISIYVVSRNLLYCTVLYNVVIINKSPQISNISFWKDNKNKVRMKLIATIISSSSRVICKVWSCWGSLPIIHAVVKVLHVVHWSSSCQSYKTGKIKSIRETLVHEWKV